MRKSKINALLFTILVAASLSGETGFSISLSSLSGGTSNSSAGLGADFIWRSPLGDGPLYVGCNAGARLYGPSAQTTVSNLLIAAPVTVNLAVQPFSAPLKIRIGAGAGAYVSYLFFADGGTSLGLVPIVEPFIEIAVSLGNLDIVCIPSYTAIFDMIAPSGTYAQEITFRAGILFGTTPAADARREQ
ncbi:MAG: hypothetical protein HZC28_04995 [Spirochaetes bacterium]|nr:hypothetical protein [Spirochaetota bacterium]